MAPADVPTVREILADYIDADDPYYAKLIDALNEREAILREAAEREVSRLKKTLKEIVDVTNLLFPPKK